MVKYLYMDGIDDKLIAPSMTFTKIELDILVEKRPGYYHTYIDAREGASDGYFIYNPYSNTDGYGTVTIESVTVNGVAKSSNTDMITHNQRSTAVVTFKAPATDDVAIFTRYTLASDYTKGNIWSVKFYNGATLVAHYDMSTGTVQDQSGNGNHATLTGGTWLDDGTGGGAITQDGTAALTGTSVLSASGKVLKNGLAELKGTGLLSSSPIIIKNGQGTILGTGLLVASGESSTPTIVVDGSASLLGQALLSATPVILKNGQGSLIGTGVMTADGTVIDGIAVIDGTAILTGTGVFSSTASKSTAGEANLLGIGVLYANGDSVRVERYEKTLLFSMDVDTSLDFEFDIPTDLQEVCTVQQAVTLDFDL